MADHLRLVEPASVVCWPWHLHRLACNVGHPCGDTCSTCGRDVAVPPDAKGAPICLYCGMDAGLVEMVDVPPGEDWTTFRLGDVDHG